MLEPYQVFEYDTGIIIVSKSQAICTDLEKNIKFAEIAPPHPPVAPVSISAAHGTPVRIFISYDLRDKVELEGLPQLVKKFLNRIAGS